jgi:hypothetical protein
MPFDWFGSVRSRLIRFLATAARMQLVDTKRHGHEAATGNVGVGGGGGGNEAEAGASKHGARPQGRRRKGTPHRAPFGS